MGRIENGKLVFERVKCWNCEGKGRKEYHKICERYGKPQRGRKCQYCGSTTKDGHKTVGVYMNECDVCRGEGVLPENSYSCSTFNPFDVLPVRVVREDRDATWNENYFGFGCFYSVSNCNNMDKITDEELVAKVKKEGWNGYGAQYTKFVKNDMTVADEIVIVVHHSGYSVRAYYKGA